MLVIAVDFDGVLHDYKSVNWPELGREILDAQPSMLRLARKKHELIIFSARAYDEESRNLIGQWLDEHRIPYHKITNIKPGADYYLDDKAIRFESWTEALRQLN